MGFGGSSSGAQVSLKNNRRERSPKTEKFFRTTGSKIDGITSHKTSTPEELQELKQRLVAENKRRTRTIYLITAALFGIFLLLFIYFMF